MFISPAKFEKFSMIENWLWKLEIGTFWPPDFERLLIYQKILGWKKCRYHLIKFFDVGVAEKFLNGIYEVAST